MTARYLPILLSILWIACARPDARVETDTRQLAAAYHEILELKMRVGKAENGLTADSFRTQSADVLRKHGYTAESFRDALTSLSRSPERIRAFADDVNALITSSR